MNRILKFGVKYVGVAIGIGLVLSGLRNIGVSVSEDGDTSTQMADNEQPKPERLFLNWYCHKCDKQYRIKTKRKFEAWLRAGNVIVFDCKCGTRYIASDSEVDNYDWFLLQGFFRHLLNRQDIISEVSDD